PGEFGRGWHLLLPYRITPHGAEKKQFQTVAVPAEMQVLNLVTGRSDVLFFRTDRAEGVGYFPAATEQAALSSLLLLSDASFLLTDKIGCRFELDQSGRLKSMRYAAGHVVKLSYPDGLFKGFDADPYEVRPLPADGERIEFRGASVPRRVAVVDMHGRSEQLRFGSTGNIVGYVPEDRESRFELLALLSDGSFQLRDKHGNETRFDGRGNFAGMILPVLSQPVSAMEMGSHRVVFRFAIDRLGHLIIDSAWILPIEPGSKPLYVVSYKYDDAGGLARVALETPEGKPVLAATHAEHGVDHRLVAR
ncbi:MAG TPA: hypothetical protein VMW75_11640, partial [Thermoanaerobaculia bacterium]|nr:hypothetical protein [Thermoanaerobaculia bacterium]